MSSDPSRMAKKQIDRLFENGSLTGLGESQLLDRFMAERDELALEALVEWHGPMVLGVCRRWLADSHDIDDAFQATFLILVRKAGRSATLIGSARGFTAWPIGWRHAPGRRGPPTRTRASGCPT